MPPKLTTGSRIGVGSPASVVFVGHGSPMVALRPGAAGATLAAIARTLEQPKAVLVISPHWETERPTVGTAGELPGNRLESYAPGKGWAVVVDAFR